jgi:hypothetical protein
MIINDNGTDREMTEAEEAAYLASAKKIEENIKTAAAAQAAKAAARQAVLDKLGLTADEAQALLG